MKARAFESLTGSLCLLLAAAGSMQAARPSTENTPEAAAVSKKPPQTARPSPAVVVSHSRGNATQYRAVLDKYCVNCHNDRAKTAGLSLQKIDLSNTSEAGDIWEKVATKLRLREMPPIRLARPDDATYDGFVTWLEGSLDAAAAAKLNPGRPALHRLNRAEYANTVRDLLALEIDVEQLLPPDDSTYGFDNIADVLGVSPELLESYVTAGQKISRLAIGDPNIAPSSETYQVAADKTQDYHLQGLPFGTRGGMVVQHHFQLDGEYELKVRLQRSQLMQVRGLQEAHELEVAVDGVRTRLFTLEGGAYMYEEKFYDAPTPSLDADEGLRVRVPVKAGSRSISVTFPIKSSAIAEDIESQFSLKSYSAGGENDVKGVPHVEALTVTGPYKATGPGDTPSRRRIFTCQPANVRDESRCAKEIISTLARRAYRGTATEADIERLLKFYEQGRNARGFESGIELALWRILSAPQFVFRFEFDPAGVPATTAYRINDVELASRLSFFLWSSIPDDRLLGVAARGELREPKVLEREVRRMLADPRSAALGRNFAGQWLSLRSLEQKDPNSDLFPDFDDNLRQAFRRETEMLFESIMQEDRSVLDLLNADYTFVNERLARHYGIPNIYGSRFQRVTVPEYRRGLLGHGSILTAMSYPTRTSPVLRGKWVLENLVGSPPPPPPPDVSTLEETPARGKELTMRERLAEHRRSPICASCHSRMDPIGFALEPFDAVGRWRYSPSIDASGALSDGTKFDGPAQLREALLKRPETYVRTLTERLLTYALGRGLEYYDAPVIRTTTREAANGNYAFSSIVLGIVKSAPFQMKRAADAERLGVTQASAATR